MRTLDMHTNNDLDTDRSLLRDSVRVQNMKRIFARRILVPEPHRYSLQKRTTILGAESICVS